MNRRATLAHLLNRAATIRAARRMSEARALLLFARMIRTGACPVTVC